MKNIYVFLRGMRMFIFLVFILFFVSCQLIEGFLFDRMAEKRFKEWYKNEFVPSNFRDTIHSIYDYSTFTEKKIVIRVHNRFSYGTICVSKETIDFLRRGDSIIKEKNKSIFFIKKKDGRIISFEVNFCN
jgi:hypothetical protein